LTSLFISSFREDLAEGNVLIYQGEYFSWSLQQILSPPPNSASEFTHPNYFGASIASDDLHQSLYVGCPHCRTNATGAQGVIYVFEQDTWSPLPLQPSAFKRWHLSHELTWPEEKIDGSLEIAKKKIIISEDLMLVDSSPHPLLFRKDLDPDCDGKFHPDTAIDLGLASATVTDFHLYGDLIALSVSAASVSSQLADQLLHPSPSSAFPSASGAIHLISISRSQHRSIPSSWSFQQSLSLPSEKELLAISLDAKGLTVMTSALDLLVYKRAALGLWSLQQVLTPPLPDPLLAAHSPPPTFALCAPCTRATPPLGTHHLRGFADSFETFTWRVLTIETSQEVGNVSYFITDLANGAHCERRVSQGSWQIDLPEGEYHIHLGGVTEFSLQWSYCDLRDQGHPLSSSEQLTVEVKEVVDGPQADWGWR
jgi:hypothetical protein